MEHLNLYTIKSVEKSLKLFICNACVSSHVHYLRK